jgi:hypothetical protein
MRLAISKEMESLALSLIIYLGFVDLKSCIPDRVSIVRKLSMRFGCTIESLTIIEIMHGKPISNFQLFVQSTMRWLSLPNHVHLFTDPVLRARLADHYGLGRLPIDQCHW